MELFKEIATKCNGSLVDGCLIEIETLRQQLAEMRESYDAQATETKEAWARNAGLLEQLAEKDAEIERLKEDGNMPVKYYQPNGKGQVYAVYGASSINFADSLFEQLAASQAREAQLRDVLHKLACLGNGAHHGTSDGNRIAQEALAIPADTSALEDMIAEAGEVMRTRCANKCTDPYYTPDGFGITGADRRCAEAICALPIVTLEGLRE